MYNECNFLFASYLILHRDFLFASDNGGALTFNPIPAWLEIFGGKWRLWIMRNLA